MSISNIDTFEQDIREEIKNKEASVGAIASASGTVGNSATPDLPLTATKSNLGLIIFAVVVVLFILGAFGYLAYVYMQNQATTKQEAADLIEKQTQTQNTEEIISKKLTKISTTLAAGVSHFTSTVDTPANGTILALNNYGAVFAFMLKNEQLVAKDMLADEIKKYENSTTTPDLTFADDTKSNQNFRYLTVGSSTLVYAFFGEQYLVFSSSEGNILQLRGTIIK